jgi:glycosyltransferase involved in cell wall biosynthesis
MIKNILMVHNYYQSHAPSGEDGVFREDEKLIRSKGHKVILFTRHSDIIKEFSPMKKVALMCQIAWSRESYKAIEQLINLEKPDIVHVCNTFPLISPSIYYACRKNGIPVVQTVQNYRLFCASGIFFRGENICEECIEHSSIRAIKYGCYRNSRIQTLPIVFMHQIHRLLGTWSKCVDLYIAATEFSRQKLIQGGLPAEQVVIKPNFFLSIPEPSYSYGDYAVFFGRLSVEKGVRTLLSAWKQLKIPLKIVGDGVLREEVISATKAHSGSSIEFLGFRPHEQCLDLIKHAMFMVMPSEWYEGFPMTIREAFASGKPVVASRMGAMAEIVNDGKTGLLFEPGNPDDLAEKVQWLAEHKEIAVQMGKSARVEFETKYTAEKNYEILMNIYKIAIKIHNEKNAK